MLNSFSGLCLLAIGVISVVPLQQGPSQEPAAASPKVQAPAADLPNGQPSALQGMLAGLDVLETWGRTHSFELLGARSDYRPSRSGPDQMVVELEVRVHAAGGTLAEAGFLELQRALDKRAAAQAQGPSSYDVALRGMVQAPWLARSEPSGPGSGTHHGVVHFEQSVVALPLRTDADEPSTGWPSFIRYAAQAKGVQLGALVITPNERQSKGWMDRSLKVRPDTRSEQASVTRTQLANFLWTLEDRQKVAKVTSLRFQPLADGTLSKIEIQLTERVPNGAR